MSFLARSSRAMRPILARAYATDAVAAGLRLTFAVPHQTIYKNASVTQVNIAAVSGDMGILASHVPSIEQLRPGVVEVLEASGSKRFFVSGGFAVMHPDSSLDINAIEAFPVEEFSAEAVSAGLAEAHRVANAGTTEEDKIAAKIEVEVFEALQAALNAK
ncbi:delta subunit of the central stalk of mitochondrial F1F0 ATP synthase, atp16 [Podila epicladia]|nr:delta subunit of the central stalk of mitochondrial F1F0 ATP synthase, atp16 [Podila epicladia]